MSGERISTAAKWTGLVIAVTGLVGALAELYLARSEFERTSVESERELADTIEELQRTIVDLDTRIRVIEILASRRTVVEFNGAESSKSSEPEPVMKKAIDGAKKKFRKVRRPWTQQAERGTE